MIDFCGLVAVVAGESVELGVATGSYICSSTKVRLLGRNTVIMVVKYDYKQARVKMATKKTNWGTQGRSHMLKRFPSVLSIQIRGKM